MAVGTILHADDKSDDSDLYKTVKVKGTDGKSGYIRVQKQADPLHNFKTPAPTEKYDPTRIFSHTSSLSNKSFSSAAASVTKSDSAQNDFAESTFITKTYSGDARSTADESTPNLNTKYKTQTSAAYARDSSGFDKGYATSSADSEQSKAALIASATSPDQGRTAVLGTRETSTYASSLSSKTYLGPEADRVHRDLERINEGMMQIKDLPNRPLTVDEVRALINHGFKPNTTSEPEAPTKPLNDPDYKPEASPAPPPSEDDKDDAIPPPGMMAQPQPEDSEPLPSR